MDSVVVIGGGIVGLAVARAAGRAWPGARITVLEKESRLAAHQTGHNSGVVHSGLYYSPGSLKAELCVRGVKLLREFCAGHGIEVRDIGKVVVATGERELPKLRQLYERGTANGVPGLSLIDAARLKELEPHAQGIAALHSPTTAIVDYVAVADALAKEVAVRGEVVLGARVVGLRETTGGHLVMVDGPGAATYRADIVIACAGLQSDRIAALTGDVADPAIVPFRGEYYRLRTAGLVRGLVYPVPDPRYPFLGVHFTPTISRGTLVGPNAVLALARERYRRGAVNPRDMADYLRWPGFWAMARRHWQTGALEIGRSLVKAAYVRTARRYLPELRSGDLERAPAGIRAQAVAADGGLLDDFRITRHGAVVHVRNAPSPGATASLAIAEYVCRSM